MVSQSDNEKYTENSFMCWICDDVKSNGCHDSTCDSSCISDRIYKEIQERLEKFAETVYMFWNCLCTAWLMVWDTQLHKMEDTSYICFGIIGV